MKDTTTEDTATGVYDVLYYEKCRARNIILNISESAANRRGSFRSNVGARLDLLSRFFFSRVTPFPL
jgi:hypothetical protein